MKKNPQKCWLHCSVKEASLRGRALLFVRESANSSGCAGGIIAELPSISWLRGFINEKP